MKILIRETGCLPRLPVISGPANGEAVRFRPLRLETKFAQDHVPPGKLPLHPVLREVHPVLRRLAHIGWGARNRAEHGVDQCNRDIVLWTPGELRRFLLAAPETWRPMWLVAVFAGLRPEELQAMSWTERNWPDFTANAIHVNCGYEAKSKVLDAPKTDESPRAVDMVPALTNSFSRKGSKLHLTCTCPALYPVQPRAGLFYPLKRRNLGRMRLPAASCSPVQQRAWWGGKDSNLRRHSAS